MSLSHTGFAPTHALRSKPDHSVRRQIGNLPASLEHVKRLRTVLVANDELLRHGLTHVVSRIEGVQLVGDARYGAELTGRLRALRPDLLVIGYDRSLVLGDLLLGFEPVPKVVVVIDSDDTRANAIDLLRAGADALVDRRSSSNDLLGVIQRVLTGQTALDAHSVNAVISELRAPHSDATATCIRSLTRREREVLNLLTEGLDNRTIASRLFVSEATVKFHLHNIMGKFGVHKRAALIAAALGGRPLRGH